MTGTLLLDGVKGAGVVVIGLVTFATMVGASFKLGQGLADAEHAKTAAQRHQGFVQGFDTACRQVGGRVVWSEEPVYPTCLLPRHSPAPRRPLAL